MFTFVRELDVILQRALSVTAQNEKKNSREPLDLVFHSVCFHFCFSLVFRISSREKPPTATKHVTAAICATYFKWGSKSDLYQRGRRRQQQQERGDRLSSQRLRQGVELPSELSFSFRILSLGQRRGQTTRRCAAVLIKLTLQYTFRLRGRTSSKEQIRGPI
jgi:hypothetical protein